jgi:hypothetical protein
LGVTESIPKAEEAKDYVEKKVEPVCCESAFYWRSTIFVFLPEQAGFQVMYLCNNYYGSKVSIAALTEY